MTSSDNNDLDEFNAVAGKARALNAKILNWSLETESDVLSIDLQLIRPTIHDEITVNLIVTSTVVEVLPPQDETDEFIDKLGTDERAAYGRMTEWRAPAGLQHGVLNNVVKLAYNPDRSDGVSE